MHISCPECMTAYDLDSEVIGQIATCACGNEFVVAAPPSKKTPREICFTGFQNEELANLLRQAANAAGMKAVKSVTVKLSYLCIGLCPGPRKLEKAKERNAEIIDLAAFFQMINYPLSSATRCGNSYDETLAALTPGMTISEAQTALANHKKRLKKNLISATRASKSTAAVAPLVALESLLISEELYEMTEHIVEFKEGLNESITDLQCEFGREGSYYDYCRKPTKKQCRDAFEEVSKNVPVHELCEEGFSGWSNYEDELVVALQKSFPELVKERFVPTGPQKASGCLAMACGVMGAIFASLKITMFG